MMSRVCNTEATRDISSLATRSFLAALDNAMAANRTPRHLAVLTVLLLLSVPALLWLHLLPKARYCGPLRITLDPGDELDTHAFGARGYNLSGSPVTPLRVRSAFVFPSGWKAYSRVYLYTPHASISRLKGIHIAYAGQDFSIGPSELILVGRDSGIPSGAPSSGHDIYDLPSRVSAATPFFTRNLSLFYSLMSISYRRGTYVYHAGCLALLLSGSACVWAALTLKARRLETDVTGGSQPATKRRLALITAALTYLLILCLAVFLTLHAVLVFCYRLVPATAGFALYTAFFMALYLLAGLLLLDHPSSRRNVRLAIAALYVGVCLAEALLRVTHIHTTYLERRGGPFSLYASYYAAHEIGWYHVRPSKETCFLRSPEFSFERTTNSLGLSDKEPPADKKPGEYRIIALGDSFTEGDGAPEESAWPRVLKASLERANPAVPISCINAGVSGSDPFFEYVLLRDLLLPLRPDLVIVAINEEASEIMVRGGMERFKPDGTVQYKNPPSWEWLYASSHIARLVTHRLLGYDYLFFNPAQRALERDKAVLLIEQSVRMLQRLAEENHFTLLVVCHPLQYEVERGSFEYLSTILAACRTYGIEHLDMLEYFLAVEKIGRDNAGAYYWAHDGHHNARGYAAFARGVQWKLEQMGIPSRRPYGFRAVSLPPSQASLSSQAGPISMPP